MAENWMDEIGSGFEKLPIVDFKLSEGQETLTKRMTILDLGKTVSGEYGMSVVFTVSCDGERKSLWIKKKHFSVLSVLADAGKKGQLVNGVFEFTRTGKGVKDTRRTCKMITPGEYPRKVQ